MDDPLYDNIAAFAAGLVANGIGDVVISPGSRSTPLAVTLHAHPSLRTWIHLDERSAGFFALGMARVSGRPSVLVCTSGTAAANYLSAVVEAHHGGVPMIVCTADRPPELVDWGAGQTIDQVGIYGTATRWAASLPVASEWSPEQAERTAMRAVAESTGLTPGPVHLNWPFRLPLEPLVTPPVRDPAFAPSVVEMSGGTVDAAKAVLEELAEFERGVIVVGPSDGIGLEHEHALARAVSDFATAMKWPVLAEPITQLRRGAAAESSTVVASADLLLRDQRFASLVAPDVVLRVGRAPTTKAVRVWMEDCRPGRVAMIDPAGHWHEPSFTLTDHLAVSAEAALTGWEPRDRSGDWLARWDRADREARDAIARLVGDEPLMAPLAARVVVEALPAGAVLVTSNSMAVRDLDSFVSAGGAGISIVGNRGASGIDGITSTALGVAAASSAPVAVFIGDLALLHDLGALPAARRLGLSITVVCVDNDGGEIFSMLPVAKHRDDIDFDTLFRTSHGLDLAQLQGFGGIRVTRVDDPDDLAAAVSTGCATGEPGVDLIIVTTDPDSDMDQHRRIATVVAEAITE